MHIDFYLTQGYVQQIRNFLVGVALHIPQLNDAFLFFRQQINHLPDMIHHISAGGFLFRRGALFHKVKTLRYFGQLLVFAAGAVNRQISGHGHTHRLHTGPLVPVLSLVPDFNHDVLHDVLRFLIILHDSQGKPVELVFQR